MSDYGHSDHLRPEPDPVGRGARRKRFGFAQAADQAGAGRVPATQKRIQDSRTGPRRSIINDKPISSGHRNREEMHA